MTKNVVSKKIFVQLVIRLLLALTSCFFRIINADTLCGRISNPPEREIFLLVDASPQIKYRFSIFYKNNCTT